MVASMALTPSIVTLERLVDLLETDGLPLRAAVWTQDEIDRWRLYLVPKAPGESGLKSTIRVATTLSKHADELPDRDDLLFSVVESDHPIIRAVESLHLGRLSKTRKIEGAYAHGQYIDKAYVLRLN